MIKIAAFGRLFFYSNTTYIDSTQKLRNAYISTKIITMHSIEYKLIGVKEAKALQQILHSFLHG